MVLLLLFRDTTDMKNVPKWRNWQTHLTQNQAVSSRAGSSPASGIKKALEQNCSRAFSFLKRI